MKAIVCTKLGLPNVLSYQEVPTLEPGPNELVLEMKACAINFPDTLIIQGKYQVKPELPFTPGSDVAGVVLKIGSAITQFKIGDRVLGMIPFGGMAEQVKVSINNTFKIPDSISFEQAASFLYAYGTAYHALKDRAQLRTSESIVILGASGGVGLAAVVLAKRMGARVIACASTSEKLDLCRQYGADELINYEKENLKLTIKTLTAGKGANVIFDPVGGNYSEQALRGLAWKGRYLVVGFASGAIPAIPFNLPLLKGCSIQGVFWSRFAKEEPQLSNKNNLEIVNWFMDGSIKTHIQRTYKLAQAAQALEAMMDRKVLGKVVVLS